MHTIFLRRNGSEQIQYDSLESSLYIRRGKLSDYPNFAAVSHWHEEVEFIAVLSGAMDYSVDGAVVPLREGEGIFVNSRRLHYGFSRTRGECDFLCILLHPMLLCSTGELEKRYIQPVLQSDMPYLRLSQESAWQAGILRDLRTMYEVCGGRAGPLKVHELFFRIWGALYENAETDKGVAQAQGSLSALKEMISFIQRRYGETLTLGDIAAAGKVCKSRCCQIFQRYVSRSPVNYLNDYRLDRGIELLKETDKTVTEIGFEVGFSGSSYFAEIFKSRMGCTPVQFRAKARRGEGKT